MRLALVLLLLLAACGRPLTPAEKSFAKQIHGPTIDTAPIRFVVGAPVDAVTFTRPKRPRLACRERIFPEPPTDTVTVSPAAVALYNRVFYAKPFYLKDYMRGYPKQMGLVEAMFFAHEMTHVWQWQNRAVTGYTPYRASREHRISDDPYLFDISTKTRFLDYSYEQQASIVEEYICCATLDPDAPRTARLRTLIKGAMPLQTLRIPGEVALPWDGVQTEGICR